MALTLGLLHKQTPLTVPRAAVTHDQASGAQLTLPQHHALMGYLELDDPARPGEQNLRVCSVCNMMIL